MSSASGLLAGTDSHRRNHGRVRGVRSKRRGPAFLAVVLLGFVGAVFFCFCMFCFVLKALSGCLYLY